MRAKIALLLSVSLLTGAIAATAQPLPCASVAPEVRERVREAGACRDATPEDVAPKGASPAPSSAVTMKLSDGTVVRIPSEISSTINDGRKRAATNETAKPKGAPRASAQTKPDASAGPALQKLKVPDVIGRSYVGAGNALGEFKVDRIETASAAPAGEVLAQEPAPATLVLPGSTISLRVSDGSLASVADKTSVTAPATAAAPPSAPAPAAELRLQLQLPQRLQLQPPQRLPPSRPFRLHHALDSRSRSRQTLRSSSALACCSVCYSAHS